jgi:hypothetical protein
MLAKIRKAIGDGKVNVTDHADEEMAADKLSLGEVYFSVMNGKVIESYPEDFAFPSCLINGKNPSGKPVHSVWAHDAKARVAILITVYRPDPARWIDFERRRR